MGGCGGDRMGVRWGWAGRWIKGGWVWRGQNGGKIGVGRKWRGVGVECGMDRMGVR